MASAAMPSPEIDLSLRPEDLRTRLLNWYDNSGRSLPWRQTKDPYAIWVSEIMLQQTQVKTVIPYYERWLATFPTIAALADADLSQVLKLWEGLGYYNRARNLHRAAQRIAVEHGGTFPEHFDAVLGLPGIGRSTAGAILSSALGQPHAILDANVRRVLLRLLALPPKTAEATLWNVSEALLDCARPHDFNQAMMDLGATVCLPRRPLCLLCPWQTCCRAQDSGTPEHFGGGAARRERPVRHYVGALIAFGSTYLLVQRPERGLLAGLWEFPCLELPPGLDSVAHLREVFGADLAIKEDLGTVEHTYTHLHTTIRVYAARWRTGACLPGCITDRNYVWMPQREWSRYAMPGAAHKMARLLSSVQDK